MLGDDRTGIVGILTPTASSGAKIKASFVVICCVLLLVLLFFSVELWKELRSFQDAMASW